LREICDKHDILLIFDEVITGFGRVGKPFAALATLDIYLAEGLLTRAATLSPLWEDAIHSLRGLPHVIDVRNYGLIGAVELEPRPGKPAGRGYDVFTKCFERGVMVRQTGDVIALSPPLIIEPQQITQLVETLGEVIRHTP
jgi:beta-alanine--pyruvate transaminase